MFVDAQLLVMFLLTLALFVVEAWAFIYAARRPAAAFTDAGKRTKTFWMVLTGVAMAIGFLGLRPPLGLGMSTGLLDLAAIVAAAVYLADVRPAVRHYRRGSRDQRGSW